MSDNAADQAYQAIGPGADDWVDELVEIMARLRGENGCPWDLEQTHETLVRYLIEEAFEYIDAVDQGDTYAMMDELGDLLLQIVFHCQLANEDERFDLQDVARCICEKMVRRHPHVFGEGELASADEVLAQWDVIKQQEGRAQPVSRLDKVPRSMPALPRAEQLQKQAAKVGFDWPDAEGALAKLVEEANEVRDAADPEARAEELGDLLFSAVNVCRLYGVDPETALRATNNKFVRRFKHVEDAAVAAGRDVKDCDLQELDAWWDEAKQEGK
jgi:tetrapyrrole methylase family protein/MazG family protein